MYSDAENNANEFEEIDPALELAIRYTVRRSYPPRLSKKRKRAVRKRASALTVDKGEVLLKRKGRQVKVGTAVKDQRRILESFHSDLTSGHFGTTKTWRRVAEQTLTFFLLHLILPWPMGRSRGVIILTYHVCEST